MNSGLMWVDTNPTTPIERKLAQAASYYEQKYGQTPNCCFVNPATTHAGKVGSIEVRVARWIMPNNFWIGVNGETHETPTPPEGQ